LVLLELADVFPISLSQANIVWSCISCSDREDIQDWEWNDRTTQPSGNSLKHQSSRDRRSEDSSESTADGRILFFLCSINHWVSATELFTGQGYFNSARFCDKHSFKIFTSEEKFTIMLMF